MTAAMDYREHTIDDHTDLPRKAALRNLKVKLRDVRQLIQSDANIGRVNIDNHIQHDFFLMEYKRAKAIR